MGSGGNEEGSMDNRLTINTDQIRSIVFQSIQVKQAFSDELYQKILKAAQIIVNAYENHHKLIFMGNGGSAADAQHLAAEFVGRFAKERKALPALALNGNSSSLTAISNDYSYSMTFSRQIEAFANAGDVVVGISTSGNSENVVVAMQKAKEAGLTIIGLTGETGGKIRHYCDILLNVPSKEVPRIQEAHIMIGHIICEIVECGLFKKEKTGQR